jgi:hypothetical protein
MFSERYSDTLLVSKRAGGAMSQEPNGIREPRDYFAYLLRLWREKGGAAGRWRASLQDPHSGERRGFANLEELCSHLRQEMDHLPEPDKDMPGEEVMSGQPEITRKGERK